MENQNPKRKEGGGFLALIGLCKRRIVSLARKVQNYLKQYPPVIRYLAYAACTIAIVAMAYAALFVLAFIVVIAFICAFVSGDAPENYGPTDYDLQMQAEEERRRYDESLEEDRQNDIERQKMYDRECHY